MTSSATKDSESRPRRSQFASALSSAVLEMQRFLSSGTRPNEDEALYRSAALSGVINTSTQASAFELQRFAKTRLAAVRAGGDATPTGEALESFETMIRSLVIDNGPTPQVGATPSGSVEIQWLVDGNLVSTLFDESGACFVLALDKADAVLLDAEVPPGNLPEDLKSELAQLLKSMGGNIVARPKSWSLSGERG
ncbi:hypothetical protein [Pengzhenrongella sicca]|uniref:Uncharacterized protein n=1 Tax=Pengzhenrongella sicca TaxID=2819238 RepID=A0A8A4ZFM9_9MICO|nr:hypothetical protein [Pengzhenrongella sicca]QTE29346.1 hypothetical protein J4E96_19085 [Pengzhenrongella sicca]